MGKAAGCANGFQKVAATRSLFYEEKIEYLSQEKRLCRRTPFKEQKRQLLQIYLIYSCMNNREFISALESAYTTGI